MRDWKFFRNKPLCDGAEVTILTAQLKVHMKEIDYDELFVWCCFMYCMTYFRGKLGNDYEICILSRQEPFFAIFCTICWMQEYRSILKLIFLQYTSASDQ